MNLKNIQLPYLLGAVGIVGLGAYLLLRKKPEASTSTATTTTRALKLGGGKPAEPDLFAGSGGTYQRTLNAPSSGIQAPRGASTGPSTKTSCC